MNTWSLHTVLESLHSDIRNRLDVSRKTFGHPSTMGDASEAVWLELLNKYLPQRYSAEKAFVVDSNGKFSDQIDVVVFDRQYSPFILDYQNQKIVPAESVYAVFESKQSVNATQIKYARNKVETVRCLHRTSLPIPYAGGTYPAKPLSHILGGLLAFESDWKPAPGKALLDALAGGDQTDHLDMGCIAEHGIFTRDGAGTYIFSPESKPATAFLFDLLARLQDMATVPMIDIRAYGRWLETAPPT